MDNEKFKLEVYEHIKYFVRVNGLTEVLLSYDRSLERDDIIHEMWADFFEREYNERFCSDKKLSLKSYVFQFFKWFMLNEIEKRILQAIWEAGDVEFFSDESQLSPGEVLLNKEINAVLEECNYGGLENRLFTEGVQQTDMGKLEGVTKQAIHQRIKKQRKILKQRLKKYL